MVGEPVGASVALIVVMLSAWLGALGIGIYVAWASIREVDASTTREPLARSDPTPAFGEELV